MVRGKWGERRDAKIRKFALNERHDERWSSRRLTRGLCTLGMFFTIRYLSIHLSIYLSTKYLLRRGQLLGARPYLRLCVRVCVCIWVRVCVSLNMVLWFFCLGLNFNIFSRIFEFSRILNMKMDFFVNFVLQSHCFI